uniref:AraC family transcriptional regulator n=1 Tax=Heterorhabditis bacteriophora TaxID=37862 RepID=A0A1I7X5G6_HETBA
MDHTCENNTVVMDNSDVDFQPITIIYRFSEQPDDAVHLVLPTHILY